MLPGFPPGIFPFWGPFPAVPPPPAAAAAADGPGATDAPHSTEASGEEDTPVYLISGVHLISSKSLWFHINYN